MLVSRSTSSIAAPMAVISPCSPARATISGSSFGLPQFEMSTTAPDSSRLAVTRWPTSGASVPRFFIAASVPKPSL